VWKNTGHFLFSLSAAKKNLMLRPSVKALVADGTAEYF
jgi:hypothetical protein